MFQLLNEGFPPRILALLRDVADRKGTATHGPWEDGNGERLQDDAEAALHWIGIHIDQAAQLRDALEAATAYVELFTSNGVRKQPPAWAILPDGDFDAQSISDRARGILAMPSPAALIAEYNRLYAWRAAWQALASSKEPGRKQSRQERIERRAKASNARIVRLMRDYDACVAGARG